MFYNIKCWGSGTTSSKLTIDGVEKTGILLSSSYILDGTNLNTSHSFYNTSACIHDNIVHIFGGNYDGEITNKHFIIEDEDFKYIDDMPIYPTSAESISFGGKIHVFTNQNQHYTWNEKDGWVREMDLPFESSTIASVVYRNDLFLFDDNGSLYEYDSGSFIEKDNCSLTGTHFKVVTFNGKIHVLGPFRESFHYTWDYRHGFVKLDDLPTSVYYNPVVVDSKYIYILGNGANEVETDDIFIYDGKTWKKSGMSIPYKIDGGTAVHDGENISYLIGGNTTDDTTKNFRKLFKKIYVL